MTFLASVCSKSLAKMQLNQKKFEFNCLNFRYNMITREMSQMAWSYSQEYAGIENAPDVTEDPYYHYLESMSEQLNSQKEAMNNEVTLLQQEITEYEKLITNGIKSSCGLTISGGS